MNRLPILPTLLIFISLLFIVTGHSQQVGYRLYTVADGLVQSEVVAIHQDKKGFLWIGTKNGISRFDGYSFTTVSDSLNVAFSHIRYINDLDDSTVFILTSKGYLLYEYGSRHDRVSSGKLTDGYAGFWIDKGKAVVIEKNDSSGIQYEIDRRGIKKVTSPFLHLVKDLFFPGSWVSFVHSAKTGLIYFIDNNGQLSCIRNGRRLKSNYFPNILTIYSNDDEVYFLDSKNPYIRILANDADRNINEFKAVRPAKIKLCRITDTTVTVVRDFGSEYSRLFRGYTVYGPTSLFSHGFNDFEIFNGESVDKYTLEINISGGNLIDREGNLWLGSVMGLIRVMPLCFSNYTSRQGIHENNQFVEEDLNGNIVTGNYMEGMQVISKSGVVSIPMPVPLHAVTPAEIYPGGRRDHRGIVHICMNTMFQTLWDGKKLISIPNYPVTASYYFFEDPADHTDYLGVNNGLMVCPEDGGMILKKGTPGNKRNKIVSIVRDGKGRLMLGGFHGLSFLAGDRMRHLPDEEFQYDMGANAMEKDNRNNVWIGNSTGLWFFNNDSFVKIDNPWFSDLVVSLKQINDSLLFIGGLRGIGLLDLKRYYQGDTTVIRYFDRDNGFTGNECQQNAVTIDRSGHLWFATTNSIVRLDPGKLPANSPPPPVYISGCSLIDENLRLKSLISTCLSRESIDLSFDQCNLRIEFTGLSFAAPGHILYRFMLEGHDRSWSPSTTERFTVYTNLRPGSYCFLVSACSVEGNWSEEPAQLTIIIHPAVWQTWWFLILAAMLSVLAVFIISWMIFQRIRRKKQRETENKRLLAELKFRTLRNQLAPHFIFNALNAVGSSIYRNDSKASYDLLHKFSRLIRHTLTQADQTSRTLAEELEFVQYYLEIEQIRFEGRITFSFGISDDIPLGTMVPRMILQTFVENAVKHGLMHKEGPGHIAVVAGKSGNVLELTVEDDGIGRHAATQYSGESTGKGMEIIREFIRLFNDFNKDKIVVVITDLKTSAREACGTRVVIRIPVVYNYQLNHEDNPVKIRHR